MPGPASRFSKRSGTQGHLGGGGRAARAAGTVHVMRDRDFVEFRFNV